MLSSNSGNIANNLAQIHKNISNFCQTWRRKVEDVQLLAVSKTRPAEEIRAAFNAGQVCFGENYLQEALNKINDLNDLEIEWHFIGAIQSNKTRELAQHFDWVHSVDRLKIAHRLSQHRSPSLPPLNICLQVNISREATKSGLSLKQLPSIVDEVISLPNLTLRGLMAIPAKADKLCTQRSELAKLRQALEQLQLTHPQLDTLSMGMTGDMEAAIAEGSTMLRIGTAIFGERKLSGL